MEPWNNPNLEPPPLNTFLNKSKIDFLPLKDNLESILDKLSSQSHLKIEEAILNRLMYKFDKKFRNDIGYRYLKKVYQAVSRIKNIDLLKSVETFNSMMPCNSNDEYLPSKQMLQYLLLKMQAFAKLMTRLTECAKKSAVFFFDRIKRGNSLWMSLIPYAILSRIWSIANVMLNHCCNWYNCLFHYLFVFEQQGVSFISETYIFPEDLRIWIEIHKIEEVNFNWCTKEPERLLFSLENDDKEETFDLGKYIFSLEEEKHESQMETDKKKDIVPFSTPVRHTTLDLGEKLSREGFSSSKPKDEEIGTTINVMKKNVKYNIHKEKSHSIHSVKDLKSLKEFIVKEERMRNSKNNLSLTQHLSFMQWHSLKSGINQLTTKNLPNIKLLKKFQKHWQRTCLDYLNDD